MDTPPPLTRSVSVASRLTLIELPRLSPNTESKPAPEEKLAMIAMVVVLSKIGRGADARKL
jgi:hypothetical protein